MAFEYPLVWRDKKCRHMHVASWRDDPPFDQFIIHCLDCNRDWFGTYASRTWRLYDYWIGRESVFRFFIFLFFTIFNEERIKWLKQNV